MTIFFDKTGPLVRFDGSTLEVSDLNPEQSIRWRMTRGEMFRFGLKAIWSALRASP
jgi:hypothetical protein